MVEQQHIHESFTLNDTDTQGDYTLGAGVLPPPPGGLFNGVLVDSYTRDES
jgi:hypothetical protein